MLKIGSNHKNKRSDKLKVTFTDIGSITKKKFRSNYQTLYVMALTFQIFVRSRVSVKGQLSVPVL